MNPPDPKEQLAKCAAWKYPDGTPVLYRQARGIAVETKTRSKPWMLGASSQSIGHTAVILVDGFAGGVALDHVLPILEATYDKRIEEEREKSKGGA